jgi:uncharacterized protein YjbJ (UPF0337 family)
MIMSSDPRFVPPCHSFDSCNSHHPLPPTAKPSGQFHSAKGTIKESLGNVFGSTNLQKKGKNEHAAGEAEYNAARDRGYAEGTVDRVTGKKDQVVGAVSGDESQEASGKLSGCNDRRLLRVVCSLFDRIPSTR